MWIWYVMWLECPLQNKIRFKVVMVMVMHVGPERVRPCRLYTHPLKELRTSAGRGFQSLLHTLDPFGVLSVAQTSFKLRILVL